MTSWHIRYVDVADEIAVVQNRLERVPLLPLCMIEVQQYSNPGAADTLHQADTVLYARQGIAGMVSGIQIFQIVINVMLFGQFSYSAEGFVSGNPCGRWMISDRIDWFGSRVEF